MKIGDKILTPRGQFTLTNIFYNEEEAKKMDIVFILQMESMIFTLTMLTKIVVILQ